MTLPEETDAKIKKLMKQYGKTKWEIIVQAINDAYTKMRREKNNETRRNDMS